MLNDDALELAIEQLFLLEQEIFETIKIHGDMANFRSHYFIVDEAMCDIICSRDADFPEKNRADFCYSTIVRKGNLVFVTPHNSDYDYVPSVYVFSANKEIKGKA